MSPAASVNQRACLQPNARASALGWGISVLAHVLAIAWIWHTWLPRRADMNFAPVTRIEVRLDPITRNVPLPLPALAQNLAGPKLSRTPIHIDPKSKPVRHQPPASILSDAPAKVAREPTVETDNVTTSDVPAVDLIAARAAARLIAREDEKNLVALPSRKSVVDPNADRHVVDRFERARRIDCQTARAQSTNLLGNVIGLAVDLAKNAIDDSGCKW